MSKGVKGMPTRKLTKNQVEILKNKLLKMKQNIIHDIQNMSSVASAEANGNGGEITGHGMHMADAATDMYEREFNLGLASNDREVLIKIENALKRIEDGTYGICLKTKQPIAWARLEAIPYAEYCLEAQAEIEKGL
jgi:RNA polymerase-binding protein DksA